MNKKSFQDFALWLARCGIFFDYWGAVQEFCAANRLRLSDFVGNMNANNPDTLFWFDTYDPKKFDGAKIKYTNWLKE